ncbi:TonB-dependent receptor [Sphingomonas paeninsulae]|uniref:TonB-dependent receptor n=1 Tax=Sphingomonas paeninsulae TaxID=2319844 RepID=A0A494TNU9_SPHPE|nr:TonB-dependent receptor [Sphingomonas paeninsulae]AYJ86755.1 TonB-dependent receptor [Sphingomonas paeninsulae]
MSSNLFRTRLLATSMIAGVALISSPVFAQTTTSVPAPSEPAEASAPDDTGGTIIVTGSRLQQPNLTSASPVTFVNAADIKLQGATRLEDVLNQLPQVSPQQGSAVSNGSDGTATLNLRNLGDRRTLVLVNGRRLNPGAPSSGAGGSSAADINAVPAILVKRIDVLTGGASSVYGSDAIAGVVNFVLDTDYTGLSFDTNYGVYNHDNSSTYFQGLNTAAGYPSPTGLETSGAQFDISMKMGVATSDDKGHIVAYAGYRKINALDQSSRDYSACGLASVASGGFRCTGSSNSFPANFSLGNNGFFGVGPNGTVNDGNLYNANPLNYFQRPDKRYVAGFLGHYEISDAIKPYVEFSFMDDRTTAQIAPSGLFLGSGSVSTLNCNNPLFSAAEAALICAPNNLVSNPDGSAVNYTNPDGTTYNRAVATIGRRDVEGGGRQADYRHTNYRVVLGSKGDLAPGISYDVYGQFGATTMALNYKNEFSLSRATKATDVITDTRPGSATLGQPVCRSVVDGSDPNCIPLNIFASGALSPQSLAYVLTPGFQTGETTEKIVSGSVNFLGGNYGIQSPFADDGIGLSVGAEYRKESVRVDVDQAFASGDLTGQGGPTQSINGSFSVKEVFAELQIPVVSHKPFFDELTLNGGFRYSDYTTSGSVTSYKGELVWAPIHDIRFRGGYNRAVRAPNTQELFATQVLGLGGSIDPCANDPDSGHPADTAAQCARTGVTAAQYGNIRANTSGQYQDIEGGNLNLKPEKADTFTAGVILQPTFLPGFTLSVDAFSIKIKDVIGVVGADTIVNQCALNGDPALCSLVHRDGTGSLWLTPNGYTLNTNVNSGSLKTRGIDVAGAYTLRTDKVGTIGLTVNGTYTDEVRSQKAGADFNCIGLYGGQCGFPQSKWRHTARVTWTLPVGLGLSARWRYFSKVRYEASSDQPDLAGSFNPADEKIGAQSYFDLTATARVADRFSFRIGANNIFDKSPPILSQTAAPISSFGNGNTYPTVYDANGRYIFVGVTLDM